MAENSVLQDALSEVTKMIPSVEVEGFVDDITAIVKIKELAQTAKNNVMKKLKEEVEKKGLKLSVTENGEGGKSKMIASCGYWEEELRQFRKEGGVTLASNVETLGERERRLENESKKAWSEIKNEKKEVQNQVFACKKNQSLSKRITWKPVSRSCHERA